MSKKNISVVITDLDNTLFDWFSQWYYSFSSLLERLEHDSGISRDILIPEIKTIHQNYGTSEYAFVIEEIPSLRAKFPDVDLVKHFDAAIHAYRKARKTHLRLYPGVLATLNILKQKGCLLVGYTESMSFYSNYRIRQLGLDGVLDYLYSPPDHDLPSGATPEKIRRYPSSHYALKNTKHNFTPKGELKPNPQILLDIIDEIGALPSQTLYVGDNLWKDVEMAQVAGIVDVHAAYGTAHTKEEYELLVDVTHWTDDEVRREKELRAHEVNAHTTLKRHFDEILQSFDFGPFNTPSDIKTSDWLPNQIEIWKKTVDVQKHFNDIEIRIRSLAMTFLGALAGAVGFAFRETLLSNSAVDGIPLPTFFLIAGCFIWISFWFMDRHWYHRLLYGSVTQGLLIEKKLQQAGYQASLTDSIGKESPILLCERRIRSPNKIDFFYWSIFWLILFGAFWFIEPVVGFCALGCACVWLIWWFFTLERVTKKLG